MQDRGRLMYKWADLMEQHQDELAHLETLVRSFSVISTK